MPLPILVLWKKKCILLKLKVSTSWEKMRSSCLFNSSTVHFRSSRSTTFSMRWLGWGSRDQRGSPSTSRSPSRSPAWWTSATTHSTSTPVIFRWGHPYLFFRLWKMCPVSPIIFRRFSFTDLSNFPWTLVWKIHCSQLAGKILSILQAQWIEASYKGCLFVMKSLRLQ